MVTLIYVLKFYVSISSSDVVFTNFNFIEHSVLVESILAAVSSSFV